MQYGLSYSYFRDAQGFPVTCVALLTVENSTSVSYGVSTVNPNDRGKYSKKLARHIAFSRLTKNPFIVRVREAGMKMNDLLPIIAMHVETNSSVGPVGQDAAGNYLNKLEDEGKLP